MGEQSDKPGTGIAQLLLVAAGLGVPSALVFVFRLTQNPWEILGLFVAGIGISVILGLFTGVWSIVQPKLVEGAANEILNWIPTLRDNRFRKPYLKYLIHKNQYVDLTGLSWQNPLALGLEDVFVQLSIIIPKSNSSPNPFFFEKVESGDKHNIWEWLNMREENLAVLGAAGSGKTTLLKHVTLALANRTRKSPALIPDKLPVLLLLRDQAKIIANDSKIGLASLIFNSLDLTQKPSEAWFEQYLKAGQCLVMLDGLDEVGDPDTRRALLSWVNQQMAVHSNNRFIITSRPYGFHDSNINTVTRLEVRPFDRQQVTMFINNWYIANAKKDRRNVDVDILKDAEKGATDLLARIFSSPDIAELAINPLLLGMIATVHSSGNTLPGRRVELYEEMCKVFLGKRDEARLLLSKLTPKEKQSVLQPLAYTLMTKKVRDVALEDALNIIAKPLEMLPAMVNGKDFLESVRDRSSILIEVETDVYTFAHKTFQEFLAAAHIQKEKLQHQLIRYINTSSKNDFDWWYETIRLYCALADATEVIRVCLAQKPPTPHRLMLAIDCMNESMDPEVRQDLESVLSSVTESGDPELQSVTMGALLQLRLRWLARLNDNTYVDSTPVTNAEFQLFLNYSPLFAPDHWNSNSFLSGRGQQPITGITYEAGQTFCAWLNAREPYSDWYYRLPASGELRDPRSYWIQNGDRANITNHQPDRLPFSQWVVFGDGSAHSKISDIVIEVPYYSGKLPELDIVYSIVHKLIRDRALILDKKLSDFRQIALNLNRAGDLEKARDSARDLVRADKLDFVRSRDLAAETAGGLAKALARTLGESMSNMFESANHLTRTIFGSNRSTGELSRHLAEAGKLTRAAAATGDKFQRQMTEFIEDYLLLAVILNAAANKTLRIAEFRQLDGLPALRKGILQTINKHYEKQPSKQARGNTAWETWEAELKALMQTYAHLAMLEFRRQGLKSWEPFETLRIVKARRPPETKK